eukprot:CAMPEP_0194218330 /NCGR_PEP_ID=MMETSP0156-20130528/23550_1 /TAXON_ID=33649 /ORGANISM="Thalassionema nitzschioides, Strain L26-B" /LENGTH=325 /DNA_ID=CAMNT_0038947643 /DNA_START=124 /DNA_END=1101 /DNA_ORIENTATION=-
MMEAPPMTTAAAESPLAPIDAKTRQRLAKIDGPFRPIDGPFDSNQEAWSLRLPPSLYASVFTLPLAIDKTMWWDTSNFFTIFLAPLLSYFLLLGIEGILIFYVYKETTSVEIPEDSTLCEANADTDWLLRIVCLFLATAYIFADLRQTLGMYRWVQCVPEWHPGHQEITDYCCRYSGRTSLPMQRYHDDYGVTVKKPAVGFTCCFRFSIFFLVLLPKIILAIIWLVYGLGYVASATTNTDMILHAIVVMFALKVDDVLYRVLTPDVFQTWMTHNFEITFSEEEENEAIRWLPYVAILLMGGAVAGLYIGWCNYSNIFDFLPLDEL